MEVVSWCLGVAGGYVVWTHQISHICVRRLLGTPCGMSIFLLCFVLDTLGTHQGHRRLLGHVRFSIIYVDG